MKVVNKTELHQIFLELKENKQEYVFNELYNKCGKLVYKIAFSIVKNKESSEDIRQIVFLKMWKMPQDSLPTKYEASWLYTLTKNETLNYIRKQKNEVSLDEIYYIANEDKELSGIIDRETYNKIISRLGEKEQEIVSLKILANLSFKEISQILKEPIGTIQWRYYKGVHSLRIVLSNLSMFIISMTVFITNLARKKSIKNQDAIKNKVEDIQNSQYSEFLNSNISANNILQDSNNKENETTETIVIDTHIENKLDRFDIGILSISTLFLILTVISLIFFIKHQQKAKKRVSK